MPLKITITKIIDPIILTYELIISNRRLILPTMVGLIIALTVISQTNLIMDSYRQEIFEEMIFKQSNIYDGDIIIRMTQDWGMEDTSSISSFYTNFKDYSNIFNQTAELNEYQDRILESQWYSSQNVGFSTKYGVISDAMV